jgi:hypothetical protein
MREFAALRSETKSGGLRRFAKGPHSTGSPVPIGEERGQHAGYDDREVSIPAVAGTSVRGTRQQLNKLREPPVAGAALSDGAGGDTWWTL